MRDDGRWATANGPWAMDAGRWATKHRGLRGEDGGWAAGDLVPDTKGQVRCNSGFPVWGAGQRRLKQHHLFFRWSWEVLFDTLHYAIPK